MSSQEEWKVITSYLLNWNLVANKGHVTVQTADGRKERVAVNSLQDLSAIGEILRNERPMYFLAGSIATGPEPPGDEES